MQASKRAGTTRLMPCSWQRTDLAVLEAHDLLDVADLCVVGDL